MASTKIGETISNHPTLRCAITPPVQSSFHAWDGARPDFGRTVSTFGPNQPNWAELGGDWAECTPDLVELGPSLVEINRVSGRARPDFDRTQPLVELEVLHLLKSNSLQVRYNFVRHRPTCGRSRPSLVEIGPALFEVDPSRPKVERSRPSVAKAGRVWCANMVELGRLYPVETDPNSTDINPNFAQVVQIWSRSTHMWPNEAAERNLFCGCRNLVETGPDWAELATSLVGVNQILAERDPDFSDNSHIRPKSVHFTPNMLWPTSAVHCIETSRNQTDAGRRP